MFEPTDELIIFSDGACQSNPGPYSCGFVVLKRTKDGDIKVFEDVKFLGKDGTNNMAEYGGLIAGLKWVKSQGGQNVHCYTDSQLVANQVTGKFSTKQPYLVELLKEAVELSRGFESFQIEWITRRASWILYVDKKCKQELTIKNGEGSAFNNFQESRGGNIDGILTAQPTDRKTLI